jgi:acylphosphatase
MTRKPEISVRRTYRFRGHVQGVGFRYTTTRAAEGLDVAGYVKNLPDGSVELVAEGVPAELDRLIAGLHDRIGPLIQDTQCDETDATHEYDSFLIAF